MQDFGTTPVSPELKPQPSRTSGTTAGFFSAQCPLSATQARTQFNFVHKKWRSEGYSVIGNVFFVGLNRAGSSDWLQYRCSPELHRNLGLPPPRARGPVLQHLQHVFGNSAQRRCDSVRDVLLQTFQRVVTNLPIHARTAAQFQNPSQHAVRDYTSCFAVLNVKKLEELREGGGPGLQNSLQQPWVLRNPSGGRVAPNNHALDTVFGRPRVQIPSHLMNYFPPDIKKGIGRHMACNSKGSGGTRLVNSNETLDAMKQRYREKIDAINEEYSLQLDSINEDLRARQKKKLQLRYEALQQKYKQLQQQAREFQESVLSDTDAKIQWLSKKNEDLQKEVESLNVVLEMRANQIQNLQHAKIELEQKEEELDQCEVKMQKMEARIKDLQELLNEQFCGTKEEQ